MPTAIAEGDRDARAGQQRGSPASAPRRSRASGTSSTTERDGEVDERGRDPAIGMIEPREVDLRDQAGVPDEAVARRVGHRSRRGSTAASPAKTKRRYGVPSDGSSRTVRRSRRRSGRRSAAGGRPRRRRAPSAGSAAGCRDRRGSGTGHGSARTRAIAGAAFRFDDERWQRMGSRGAASVGAFVTRRVSLRMCSRTSRSFPARPSSKSVCGTEPERFPRAARVERPSRLAVRLRRVPADLALEAGQRGRSARPGRGS